MSSSSSLFHVFALAISLVVFVAVITCLRLIMSNSSDGRVMRSVTRQEKLNKPIETDLIVTEKDRFTTEREILLHAKRTIVKAARSTELVYLNISPACGALIADSLDEDSARIHFNSAAQTLRITIMPTEVHDSCQGWINKGTMEWFVSGTINSQEFDCLCFRVGTTVRDFLGAYQLSRKEPDFMIRPGDQLHPSIVVEAGWSGSYPHLERDMRLWIDGTREVNVVLVIEWSRSSGNVRGSVEAWVRGANGAPAKRQSLVIFPVRHNQPDITITRGELLGSELLPNSNADDIMTLSLVSLQDKARRALTRIGLQPAVE